MSELRFDGRVAVVTGGGRALGLAYAHALAARGARVVVNDSGVTLTGDGPDPAVVEDAVAEIRAAGGIAVAHTGDVGQAAEAESLIAMALEQFGRIDIVVNNAGILNLVPFADATLEELLKTLNVDPIGSFNVCRAAWPHLVKQGYGRIVLSASTGWLGGAAGVDYATGKGATISLGWSLALIGEPHGIKTNIINSFGFSRMVSGHPKFTTPEAIERRQRLGPPDGVSPTVVVLSHESCPVNGALLAVGAGQVQRHFVGTTQGYLEDEMTPESLLENFDRVSDPDGWTLESTNYAFCERFYRRREAMVDARA